MYYTFWFKYVRTGGYGGCDNVEWQKINVWGTTGVALAYQTAVEEAFYIFESSQEHKSTLELWTRC